MRQFLEEVYEQAINLDNEKYRVYFPDGIDKSDFLLFGDQVVCEFKEIKEIKIRHQVEKLAQRNESSEKNFKRDFYNSINKALSKANLQIESTKKALDLPDALGLVILDNLIKDDLSVLSLIDAANRKMLGGLASVDCVLCLDCVNTFSNPDGNGLVRPAQTVVRDTDKSRKLCEFIDQLMKAFCENSDTPLLDGFDLEKGDQVWMTDVQGQYKKYEAKLDFKPSELEAKINRKQRAANLFQKWWWLIPLPFVLYDWFIN